MEREESRKGPWTEEEDLKLVYYVKILGDRRWDFVAKVSGLNRSGKSCRLRWVNYLHPDLKRGKITPQEEQLILELQSRWGNRWSRIARKLPGRTDNEIKNYWRTLMRKKAQERKRTSSSSLTSSSSCCSSSKTNIEDQSLHDKGSCSDFLAMRGGEVCEEGVKGYSMDQIWEEIASSEEVTSGQQGCNFFCSPMASPLWDCSDSLWRVDEEEIKMLLPIRSDLYLYNYEFGRQNL